MKLIFAFVLFFSIYSCKDNPTNPPEDNLKEERFKYDVLYYPQNYSQYKFNKDLILEFYFPDSIVFNFSIPDTNKTTIYYITIGKPKDILLGNFRKNGDYATKNKFRYVLWTEGIYDYFYHSTYYLKQTTKTNGSDYYQFDLAKIDIYH